jgi:hypothetical protein
MPATKTAPQPEPAYVPEPRSNPTATGWGAPPVSRQPGRFGRHGVQLLLVGLTSLAVGLVLGANLKGSSADSKAVGSTPAASQQSAPTATHTHAAAPAAKAAAPKTAPAAPRRAAAPAGLNDKGWVVQSLTVKRDFVGEFTGTARMTNTNDSSKSASFTITVLRGGQQIGELAGVTDDVAAGKTVTVDLVSQDRYSAGSYTYDFQTDFSF